MNQNIQVVRLYISNTYMIVDILLFVLGVVLIIAGANFLTDGAATLARRLGVNPLVIGLTIVALGTSAPELVVSLTSALKGNADIAVGNVVGSNIINTLLIGGVTALIAPLAISVSTIRKEIPLMILASLVLTAFALDPLLSGGESAAMSVSRSEGIALTAFFLIFLAYTFSIAKDNVVEIEGDVQPSHTKPLWLIAVLIVGGLASLVWGGNLFVDSASNIARSFGLSEAFIGLTIVALGTSLPELATTVVAALKGEAELAIGNIVGSNIFNIFFILGTTATISPITISGITNLDFITLCLSAVMLYIFGIFFGERKINRYEGGVLLLVLVVYNAMLISNL